MVSARTWAGSALMDVQTLLFRALQYVPAQTVVSSSLYPTLQCVPTHKLMEICGIKPSLYALKQIMGVVLV